MFCHAVQSPLHAQQLDMIMYSNYSHCSQLKQRLARLACCVAARAPLTAISAGSARGINFSGSLRRSSLSSHHDQTTHQAQLRLEARQCFQCTVATLSSYLHRWLIPSTAARVLTNRGQLLDGAFHMHTSKNPLLNYYLSTITLIVSQSRSHSAPWISQTSPISLIVTARHW